MYRTIGCYFVSFWVLSEVSCQGCEHNDVRLVDGGSALEGTVNICRNGRWGTVCDDEWGQSDASVVCRQLGFSPDRAEPTREAFFGQGTGPIFLSNVRCDGSEQTLADCFESRMVNCDHSEDAGVRCQGVFIEVSLTGESGVLVSWQSRPEASQYRLNISRVVNRLGHQITHNILIDLMEMENQFVFDKLLPEQNYTVCISSSVVSACTTIQTTDDGRTNVATPPQDSNTITTVVIIFVAVVLTFIGVLAMVASIAYYSCKKRATVNSTAPVYETPNARDMATSEFTMTPSSAYGTSKLPATPTDSSLPATSEFTNISSSVHNTSKGNELPDVMTENSAYNTFPSQVSS